MKFRIRIGPVQDKISDDFLIEHLRKICNFSKAERVKEFRSVYLSFPTEAEASEAFKKLQGITLVGHKLRVQIIIGE